MAWEHQKAAIGSDLYDGRGSYKNIFYRICALVRGEESKYAGWCTASEKYLSETTGFSERQVQRAVAQFKKDEVFRVRTFRQGGRLFNHYRPNMALLRARARKRGGTTLLPDVVPADIWTGDQNDTRQGDGPADDTVSQPSRQDGGVVCIAKEVKERGEIATDRICKAELRSTRKSFDGAGSPALTGKDYGDSAPEPLNVFVHPNASGLPPRVELGSDGVAIPAGSSAADAARAKMELLAASLQRPPAPPPPPVEALTPPRASAPRPTTPVQVAKSLIEETKRNAWDKYLRAYSLAYQLAGYLEDRKARGEKAYAFDAWEVMYTSDFIDAINRSWKFKDLEDLIDVAQTTKYRFICCTPRLLFENAEAVMKVVHMLRKKGMTTRQKLGEQYPSWYLENASSIEMREEKQAIDGALAERHLLEGEECRHVPDLDEDVPILTLSITGQIPCINRDCRYRFDTRAQMERHFYACFQRAIDETPINPQDALEEEMEDAHDDLYGMIPCSEYPWFYDDDQAGRWEQYAAKNGDFGTMFDPWQEEHPKQPED